MAKYKITNVPSLDKFVKGGGPGDKYYKYQGTQYKKDPQGSWYKWNGKTWSFAGTGSGAYDNQNYIYLEDFLQRGAMQSDDANWGDDKPKATVSNYETQRNKVLNSPFATTEQKIKATTSPIKSNVEINKALVQKKAEEDYIAQQKKLQKEQEELRKKEEEALKAVNPNFYNSETTQNVARASGALLTKAEQDAYESHKQDLSEKRSYLAKDYVTEHYTALSSEEKNNAMYGLKGITWDDADKLAGFVLDDVVGGGYSYSLDDDLKAAFPNATPEQIKKYKEHINNSRDKVRQQTFNTVGQWDLSKSLKNRGYYDQPIRPEDNILRSWDPNDPNRVELSGRMPQTAGEWGQRIADIIANPLDAIHYGMSPTEEMPINMYEYEKAKQQLGYEDGADQNLVFGALDFASYFTGAGSVAQGLKMLRPTGEAVYDFAQDPSWSSAGDAGLNVAFNAMAFSPLKAFMPKGSVSTIVKPTSSYAAYTKLPGNRQVLYGNPYLTEAKSVINLPGFKLAKGNAPTSGLPSVPITPANYAGYVQKTALALSDDVTKGVLPNITEPHQVTQSPLTTMTPAVQTRQPLNIDKALQEEAKLVSAEPELLPEELQYNMSPEGADFAKLAKDDNQLVTDIINDIRERKIGLWMTPEGQRRLQTMIDKTPSLAGQTPQTMIEGIASMNSLNAINAQNFAKQEAIIKKMNEVDAIYDQGYMTDTDYFNINVSLDEELKKVEEAIAIVQDDFLKSSGFYRPGSNTMGINPMIWKSDEIPKVTSHELGHYLGSFLGDGTTYLDDELKKLDLLPGTSEQLKLEFAPTTDKSTAFYKMGEGRNQYLSKSKEYFETGSGGTERVPFAAEVREDMLQKGIIESEYDKITPKMLKDHYKDYKNTRGEKYPLRIYDIMKDKKDNYDIMAKVLNNLPMIAAAAYAYDELADSDDPNVSQASIPALLAFFLKKPVKGRRLPKSLQKTANKIKDGLRNQVLSKELAKQLTNTELTKPVYLQKMSPKVDPIGRSTVNKKNDFVEKLGEENYQTLVRSLYEQNRQAYDSPLIDFKSTQPTSFFQQQFDLPHHLNSSSFLFKQKFCPPGSACAKTSNAVTNKVFSDITGKEFAVEENAHNAWHLEDQMTRHGGMNITPLLQQHGTELFKVGDRILMGNNVDQSTVVPGYTADPAVRHAGFFAGYYPTEYGDLPMLFESGNINPMYMNPINQTFAGENSVKQVIRAKQFLDDEFGVSLADKNIRYAYRDKPSVATYSSDNEAVQTLITNAEPIRDVIKKTYDITNDEFDELLVSLISIGAQETKLGATLPGTKLSKAKVKIQDFLQEQGLSKPVKQSLNLYKDVVNKMTSKSSPLPPYPGTSYVEMESAKLAAELNVPFSEALDIVKSQYRPKPKKTLSTVEPSKGIFRQKYQTDEGKLAGFEKINNQELANGMAQMAENYNKIKKMHPDADPRKIIDLTILMWNSPGKAQNKELVEFYLFGQGNPDPDKFKFDYINKVNKYRDQLINIHPQTTEDYYEFFRKGRPEIQYKEGGQINAEEKPVETAMTKKEIDNLVAQGYIVEQL
jgi:hypothetical protein